MGRAFEDTQRALQHLRHAESTQALGHSDSTQRAHGGHSETRALRNLWHSGTCRALGNLEGTRTLKALRHLSTWAHKTFRHLGTQALGHSGTWALRALRHLGGPELKALGHLGNRGTLFSRLLLCSLVQLIQFYLRLFHFHLLSALLIKLKLFILYFLSVRNFAKKFNIISFENCLLDVKSFIKIFDYFLRIVKGILIYYHQYIIQILLDLVYSVFHVLCKAFQNIFLPSSTNLMLA